MKDQGEPSPQLLRHCSFSGLVGSVPGGWGWPKASGRKGRNLTAQCCQCISPRAETPRGRVGETDPRPEPRGLLAASTQPRPASGRGPGARWAARGAEPWASSRWGGWGTPRSITAAGALASGSPARGSVHHLPRTPAPFSSPNPGPREGPGDAASGSPWGPPANSQRNCSLAVRGSGVTPTWWQARGTPV